MVEQALVSAINFRQEKIDQGIICSRVVEDELPFDQVIKRIKKSFIKQEKIGNSICQEQEKCLM
jgi:hypothetical protein